MEYESTRTSTSCREEIMRSRRRIKHLNPLVCIAYSRVLIYIYIYVYYALYKYIILILRSQYPLQNYTVSIHTLVHHIMYVRCMSRHVMLSSFFCLMASVKHKNDLLASFLCIHFILNVMDIGRSTKAFH